MDINRNYCKKIEWYTGVKRMWIATSTKDILEDITKINVKKKATSVETFDFSTLYTKIRLQDLKEKLKWCIEKAFKGGTNQWIRVTGSARFDAGKRTRKEDLYSKEDIFKMLDFIIDGSYLAVGNFVFRQQVGKPMGTDPAPFMANLYL